jgi:hypothetical protein
VSDPVANRARAYHSDTLDFHAIHLILYSTRLQDPVRSIKTFESNTAQAWPD